MVWCGTLRDQNQEAKQKNSIPCRILGLSDWNRLANPATAQLRYNWTQKPLRSNPVHFQPELAKWRIFFFIQNPFPFCSITASRNCFPDISPHCGVLRSPRQCSSNTQKRGGKKVGSFIAYTDLIYYVTPPYKIKPLPSLHITDASF